MEEKTQLEKRISGGLWVTLGGFIALVITLTLEHIDAFDLSETDRAMVLIFGTAIVTQITKYLNK